MSVYSFDGRDFAEEQVYTSIAPLAVDFLDQTITAIADGSNTPTF